MKKLIKKGVIVQVVVSNSRINHNFPLGRKFKVLKNASDDAWIFGIEERFFRIEDPLTNVTFIVPVSAMETYFEVYDG